MFRISFVAALSLLVYWFFKVRILTYNRDIVRELLQLVLNKLKKEKFILVKDVKDGSATKIILSQLDYLESSKNYVTLHLGENKVLVRSSLTNLHEMLEKESEDFFRCHRSFIINTKKVNAVHGNFFKIREMRIPIGTNYLSSAQKKIEILKAL